MRYFFRLYLVSLLTMAGSFAAADSLDELVGQRLALMQQVAAWKWHRGVPIENLPREQQVLAAATEQALRRGLRLPATLDFLSLQISAAKEIQHYWFQRWQQGDAVPDDVDDLQTVIRPRLLTLGEQIVDVLADGQRMTRIPMVAGLSNETGEALASASAAVTRYATRLEQVRSSGILRVGFTGDYPPFTYRASVGDDAPQGVDMALAREFAAHLGVELRWVKTSWPELMRDLSAGEFDIGMGGISVTAQRQQRAMFSATYHSGGKTPISRCDQRERFADLAGIDRADVRVIVNPGGTNERYVREHLAHARPILFEDNRRIFAEIIERRADVMITDSIEVRLQSALHPQLCATMPGQLLTQQDKAYLLPRDEGWRDTVDRWLEQALAREPYALRLDRYFTNLAQR